VDDDGRALERRDEFRLSKRMGHARESKNYRLPGESESPAEHRGGHIARPESVVAPLTKPSRFYRAMLWRLGLWLVRWLPGPVVHATSVLLADCYYRVNSQRREVVVRNLLPVFNGDLAGARRAAHRLFRQFGWKLADLWRYESGVPAQRWFRDLAGWEKIHAAYARKKGVLLITPHLGNWEIGGALLASRGIPLLVVTLGEPDPQLTELRRNRRAQWGIETLVIREDAFAFVEVIKRLQEGAVIALLVDRPPPPTGVLVELFGRPFLASVSAAELARATGCALIGVSLVRVQGGYSAQVLPEFEYDRRQLVDREARREFTKRILGAFEPLIRQYPDQWYHFVPIWPDADKSHEDELLSP
jgi:lauroyl/myristoyl acyltransferase